MSQYSWEDDPYNPRLGYGGYQPPAAPSYTPSASAAAPVAAKTNPYVAAGGLALGAIGTGLNAYGAYEAGKDADRQFGLQEKQFEFDTALSLEDRQRAEEERRRRAEIEAGNYANDFTQNNIRGYGGYNAMRG